MLIGFNNRSADETIPFLSPLIAPSAKLLSPALNAIASLPVRPTVEVSAWPCCPCLPA